MPTEIEEGKFASFTVIMAAKWQILVNELEA
jgi:hypothetical protein